MPDSTTYQLEVHEDLNEIDPSDWDALVAPDNPFLEFAFLQTLHEAGCVGPATTWHPRFLLLRDPAQANRLIGAVPLYLRFDSYGEYIFDHAWADAYMRAGLPYYPKGLVAVPFTPTNGERLLVHPQVDFARVAPRLIDGLVEYARASGLSSVHLLFLTEAESRFLDVQGFLTRLSTQFHWMNRDYASFSDYLDDLRSQKRKQVRKERRTVADQGLEIQVLTGDEVSAEHMDTMYRFYMDTGSRKWGRPYLNRRWFELIQRNFRHRIVLVLASHRGQAVAGTLNFHKGDKLFGRYWGSSGEYPCLHFELCYYQLIDYAIQHRVKVFEAGAQGEHKFLRGFVTRPCYSSHWMVHPEGQQAIGQFLEMERDHVNRTIEDYNAQSPLKYLRGQDRQNADWTEHG